MREASRVRPAEKTKEDKRHRVWTRGENLTQINPKQCLSSGKEAYVANQ